MVGRTISHYEVLEKLGEGGMGVVYKARDTHLDRLVALKVLPAERVADPERKRRFVQEAKAASALNHPNIITVYDIDQAGGVDFIAMEHVAGKTLEQLIPRKGLPLSQALKYAAQMAEALSKAHAAGIIHRDLKPGNVMVTEDGLAKVLDFGLAKLAEGPVGQAVSPAEEQQPTRTLKPQTAEGAIVGTVAYMSPEQAQGLPVDSRSDIFSFGSLLYEMVTGRRAFHGDTKVSTLAAILHKEPPPLAGEVPHEVERLLHRCLRKDPAKRWQTMADLKVALEELKEESDSGSLASSVVVPPARRRWKYATPLAAAMAVAAATLAFWLIRQSRPSTPTYRLTQLTRDTGVTYQPAISPDGKLVAYSSDRAGGGNFDIWVQQVAGGNPIRLTDHAAYDGSPHFSPDGSKIVFHSTREGGGVYVIPALGGDPRRLAASGVWPRFSPDGKWVVYKTASSPPSSRLYVVASDGGAPREIRLPIEEVSPWYSVWSPDSRHLLVQASPADRDWSRADWYVVPLEGGPPARTGGVTVWQRTNLADATPHEWLEDGDRIVFVAYSGNSANIWEVPISKRDWQIRELPRQLTTGTGEHRPSMARDGRMVFSTGTASRNIWRLPMDARRGQVTGSLERVTHGESFESFPVLSADGKKMVFASNRLGNYDVWMRDLSSGKDTPLITTPAEENRGLISPDGTRLVFRRLEGGRSVIYATSVQGGAELRLCDHCRSVLNWTPDGKKVVVIAGTPERLSVIDADTGQKADLVVDPEYALHDGILSPDGRWLAFKRLLGPDRQEILIAPVEDGRRTDQRDWIQVAGGEGRGFQGRPWWSPDGNVLYFISQRDGYLCLWAQKLDSMTRQPLGAAFAVCHFHEARRLAELPEIGYGMTADGLYLPLVESRSNVWLAEPQSRR